MIVGVSQIVGNNHNYPAAFHWDKRLYVEVNENIEVICWGKYWNEQSILPVAYQLPKPEVRFGSFDEMCVCR